MKAPSTLLTPIIATSLSPSLSKSPQETELLERPKKGSSFWLNVIELFKIVKVVFSVSDEITFSVFSPGSTIIVSSSSSTLSSIAFILNVPVVSPASIKISGLSWTLIIRWFSWSATKRFLLLSRLTPLGFRNSSILLEPFPHPLSRPATTEEEYWLLEIGVNFFTISL